MSVYSGVSQGSILKTVMLIMFIYMQTIVLNVCVLEPKKLIFISVGLFEDKFQNLHVSPNFKNSEIYEESLNKLTDSMIIKDDFHINYKVMINRHSSCVKESQHRKDLAAWYTNGSKIED